MLKLGIAPLAEKSAGDMRRQATLIRALCDREEAASPASPGRGRAARSQGEDPQSSPGSRQPRAGAALADPLRNDRPVTGRAGAASGIHYSKHSEKSFK